MTIIIRVLNSLTITIIIIMNIIIIILTNIAITIIVIKLITK